MSLFKAKNKHEKIEVVLTESGIITRLVFFLLAITVASYAFYHIFVSVLHTNSGWQTITGKTKTSAGNEFAFHYQTGVSGMSASQEWMRLNKLYPTLLDEGYRIFDCEEVAGMGNLYQLNAHPNEAVAIEPDLYEVLEYIQESGSRMLYYAPVFLQYKSLFACEDEYAASFFDPMSNDDVAAYVKAVCEYAMDENHISIELVGDNTARLRVSKEYLEFAKENEIDKLLDFYYFKNAFVIDYVADNLMEAGFTAGVITSAEGYVRALGEGDYSIKRYYYADGSTPKEEVFTYAGPKSLVLLRDFALYNEDSNYYFTMGDGSTRHVFLDPVTGQCRDGLHQVVASSESLGCAQILLPLYDAFVNNDTKNCELKVLGITIE